jgi:RND superfamily putative drug exporter
MDYEVFMVSRMREAHDAGESDADAVAHGLQRTGRIVTAAAAIMVVAFLGFAAGRIEGLRQFGVGLAVAVTLDATIVRAILVPSLMTLLGRWNWWLPRSLQKG